MTRRAFTTNMPPSFCKCGYKLDRATAKEPVKAGDISICFNCGNLAEWTSEGKLKELTAADIEDLRQNHTGTYDHVIRMQAEIKKRGPIKRGAIMTPFSNN
jgi:hypothetical protein